MTLSRSNGQSILLRIGRCTRYGRSFPALARSDPIFYANFFDETEINTIKLWMGSFVKDYNGPTKNVIFNFQYNED